MWWRFLNNMSARLTSSQSVMSILSSKRGGLEGAALKQYLREQAPIWTIDSTSTVSDALEKVLDHRIGALIVTEEAERHRAIAGIVTDRDLLKFMRRTANARFPTYTTPVREIMTPAADVVAVTPSDTRQKAVEIMKARNVRHLPVIDAPDDTPRLVGIISVADLVHDLPRREEVELYGASLHPEGLLFVAPTKSPERQRVVTKWTRC